MLIWGKHLETGNPDIDLEHKEIFTRLNAIGDAIERRVDPETLTELIVVLLDYSYLHFHREEHAMACAGCPLHDRNCNAHRVFVERLQNWLAVINDEAMPVSMIQDIYTETCRWIQTHIENIDGGLRRRGADADKPGSTRATSPVNA